MGFFKFWWSDGAWVVLPECSSISSPDCFYGSNRTCGFRHRFTTNTSEALNQLSDQTILLPRLWFEWIRAQRTQEFNKWVRKRFYMWSLIIGNPFWILCLGIASNNGAWWLPSIIERTTLEVALLKRHKDKTRNQFHLPLRPSSLYAFPVGVAAWLPLNRGVLMSPAHQAADLEWLSTWSALLFFPPTLVLRAQHLIWTTFQRSRNTFSFVPETRRLNVTQGLLWTDMELNLISRHKKIKRAILMHMQFG